MSINKYLTRIKLMVYQSGHCKTNPPIKIIPHSTIPNTWVIGARYITFKDGGIMQFQEVVKFDKAGDIERLEYAIGYATSPNVKDGFLYEKDPKGMIPIVHEECHLHVEGVLAKDKRIRFRTHETNFEEVFAFVVAVYYSP